MRIFTINGAKRYPKLASSVMIQGECSICYYGCCDNINVCCTHNTCCNYSFEFCVAGIMTASG